MDYTPREKGQRKGERLERGNWRKRIMKCKLTTEKDDIKRDILGYFCCTDMR